MDAFEENTSLQDRLKALLSNEVSLFIYLWIIYLLLPTLLDIEGYHFDFSINEIAFTVFYISLATINNFVLIPRYLSKGKQLQYLVLVISMLLLFSVFEDTVMEFLFEDDDNLSSAFTGILNAFVKLGTVVIIFGSFKLIWNYQERMQEINKLEKERIESELKFLKSQINPHVLFNHLNSIYYYTMEKSEKVPEMILKLSDIMRYMLYEANEKFVPLGKELDYIHNFIELEKIRHEGRSKVLVDIEGQTNNLKIAPILLISFIENSFKHSHQSQTEDVLIIIKISIEDQWLDFTAINSWSEVSDDKKDKDSPSGIGLQNVRKRLELLYPERHTLQINSDGKLFTVHMRIKLHHDKN